jgi:hypothetical protein
MSHYGPGPADEIHVGTLAQCTDPGCAPPRTAAATAARMRAREERLAAELRERGWGVVPPEVMAAEDLDMTHVTAELALTGAHHG